MIKINGLRINIINKKGLFGNEFTFEKGLNIIRGNNSSGKSTVFQSLLYGLGMEELIGGKNTAALQYVLKEKIIVDDETIPIIESNVLLEIENTKGEIITIQRYIVNEKFDSRYVKVYKGSLITNIIKSDIDYLEMYLHDKNAAQNQEFGFHAYLEKFLDISLPKVNYTDGSERKLYLQTLFPSFTIEQKNGWSDFLSTIPYYKIRDPKSKVIEYILNLDVLENQKKKTKLNFNKKIIEHQWEQKFIDFKDLISSESFQIQGVDSDAFIIKPEDSIYIRRLVEDGEYKNIDEYLGIVKNELDESNKKSVPTTGENTEKLTLRSKKISEKISFANVEKQNANNDIVLLSRELKEYKRDYSNTIKDLDNYTALKKVNDFASQENLTLPTDNCPTCSQSIKDTLLPQEIDQDYMRLDENIEHLKAQKEMYTTFISGQEDSLINLKTKLERLEDYVKKNRSILKSINRELVSDDRIPSQFEIERRIRLENQLRHYTKLRIKTDSIIKDFRSLSKQYAKILGEIKDLPSSFYSPLDFQKMKYLNTEFKQLLTKFNYRSYEVNEISIPYDGYFPTVQGLNLVKNFDDKKEEKKIEGKLKHNSSASDFVRAIWAYTSALYKTSVKFNSNHPKLLVFDEPSQHDMANRDMNNFLAELSSYSNGQSIVFASFGERDENFKEETKGIENFHLIDLSKLTKIFKFQSEL
ncbi:hypothetical protein [uncultured Polaribacter sp.]|uniref:AAA family ATPase n=1 Tax=uncultured Polaribacter sp. TaxID=174711 RepID=UPI0026161C62|nr:hypothetical protein [uncultured Polaribacter sp.]